MKKPWIFFKRHMGSWTPLIFQLAGEIYTTSSSCSTTWLFATRRCKCLKNAHSALSIRLNTCLSLCSIWKKKVFQIEWERYSLLENWSCNIVPYSLRSTDTKMHSNKPEKALKYATKTLLICMTCVTFMSREKRSTLPTRMEIQVIHLITTIWKNIVAGLKAREEPTHLQVAEIGRSAVSCANRRHTLASIASALMWIMQTIRVWTLPTPRVSDKTALVKTLATLVMLQACRV